MDAFTSQSNLNMLWEVISDENVFKYLNRESQQNVYATFTSNVSSFYNLEKTRYGVTSQSLMDINKKYILLIINYIKQTFPQISTISIHSAAAPAPTAAAPVPTPAQTPLETRIKRPSISDELEEIALHRAQNIKSIYGDVPGAGAITEESATAKKPKLRFNDIVEHIPDPAPTTAQLPAQDYSYQPLNIYPDLQEIPPPQPPSSDIFKKLKRLPQTTADPPAANPDTLQLRKLEERIAKLEQLIQQFISGK